MSAARALKILYVSNWLGTGGIETNLVLLTRELTRRGHTVLTASRGGDLVDAFHAAGGRHVELSVERRPHALARAANDLARLVNDERPDVIHVFSSSTAVVTLIAKGIAKLRGAFWPTVVSSVMGLQRGPEEWIGATYIRAYLTTWGAQRTFIIAPAIGEILHRVPVRRSRLLECQVVGIDRRFADRATADRIAAFRAELGLDNRRIVSTIGNLAPRKSHELFVRAAATIAERFPDVIFLIAGDGPLQGALQQEIDQLGLTGRVRLLGQRNDTPELIGASDVYVKPGVVEGFVGITVLEAQLVGRPVVAFDTQDVRLAIDEGKTGLIAPRGDVKALGEAIAKLLSDKEYAKNMAEAGRRSVIDKFSIEAVVDQLEHQYRELMTS